MSIFLDSNIWLRFIMADDPKMFDTCVALFQAISRGEIIPYSSSIVLLEVGYVLRSVYKIGKQDVISDLETVVITRGLVLIEKTNFREALSLHKQTGIKLADCLIASQIPKGIALCTYDMEFKKIPHLSIVTPNEIVKRSVA